jgi:hypothetical protein
MAGRVNHPEYLARSRDVSRSSWQPKRSTLAEVHLKTAQRILKEVNLPEKVDVIPAPNEFNQAISRATAL